jgi:hypothetical protein
VGAFMMFSLGRLNVYVDVDWDQIR